MPAQVVANRDAGADHQRDDSHEQQCRAANQPQFDIPQRQARQQVH